MLTALHLDKRVYAPDADRDTLSAASRAGAVTCSACGERVTFKAGTRKIWHFSHRVAESDCPKQTDPDYRPESPLHQHLKGRVAVWAAGQLAHVDGARVEVEAFIPQTRQFADVLVTLPAGADVRYVALEVQCSPLTSERWRERSAAYASAGVRDVWLLAGPRHVAGSVPPDTVLLQDLPGALLRDRGQALFLTTPTAANSDSLSAKGVTDAETLVCALHGIGQHYADIDASFERQEALRSEPFSEQPPTLGCAPWAASTDLVTRFDQSSSLYEAPLFDCQLSPGPVGAVWTGDEHVQAHEQAWKAEQYNQEWITSYTAREHAYAAEERQRRRVALGHMRSTTGALLLTLLTELKQLAQSAREQTMPQVGGSEAITAAVRKWDVRSWTPLADQAVPLEWIFGFHRRLWQMRTYCCLFYYKYARLYREVHGKNVRGFDRVHPRFALGVLSAGGVMRSSSAARAERAWQRVDRALERLLASAADLPDSTTDEEGRPVSTMHRLRELVAAAYFEKLYLAGFLDHELYYEAEEYPHPWREALSSIAASPLPDAQLLSPTATLERVAQWLRRAYPRVRSSRVNPERLLDSWIELNRQLALPHQSAFCIRTASLRPFFPMQDAQRLRSALDGGPLTFDEALVSDSSGLVLDATPRS